jgi:hypothetical protein
MALVTRASATGLPIIYIQDPTCLRPVAQMELPVSGLTEACIQLLRYQLHNGTEQDKDQLHVLAQQLLDYFGVRKST